MKQATKDALLAFLGDRTDDDAISILETINDDGIDDASIPQDVGFQLVQLLKGQWWDLALKFRVNFKRIQIHHRTVLS